MKSKILSYLLIIVLAIANLTSCAFSPENNTVQNSCTFFALDTVIKLTIYDNDKTSLLKESEELISQYESLFSATLPESDIYRINHAAGEWVTVSDDTILLLKKALDYCNKSQGTLDITVLPIKNLWDFTGDHPQIPSESALNTALSHVDYTKVELNGNKVRLKDPDAMIDLGFIAKGYITDKLCQFLIDSGVKSALLSLGGNIKAIGTKPDGSSYTVGIQEPFAETGVPITTVSISGNYPAYHTEFSSVTTSGIYERYFEQDGKIYHHIINPSTGYPVDNELASVTILSDSATDGDALSTLCLSLGLLKGTEYISSLYGVEAIFITKDNEVITVFGMPDA